MDADRDCDNDEEADDMSNGDDYDGDGHDSSDIRTLKIPMMLILSCSIHALSETKLKKRYSISWDDGSILKIKIQS